MFLVSSTGASLRDIRTEWDLPRLEQWVEYCQKHPPLQAMVAAYLGIKPEGDAFRVTEENFGEFVKMLNLDASGTTVN